MATNEESRKDSVAKAQSIPSVEEDKTKAVIEALSTLPTEKKTKIVEQALSILPTEDKTKAVIEALSTLPTEKKSDIASRAGLLFGPSQRVIDMVWLVIVLVFALVLVVSGGTLIYGVVFLQRTADNVQVILTVFIAVVGFLAGLISPSPVQKIKPGI